MGVGSVFVIFSLNTRSFVEPMSEERRRMRKIHMYLAAMICVRNKSLVPALRIYCYYVYLHLCSSALFLYPTLCRNFKLLVPEFALPCRLSRSTLVLVSFQISHGAVARPPNARHHVTKVRSSRDDNPQKHTNPSSVYSRKYRRCRATGEETTKSKSSQEAGFPFVDASGALGSSKAGQRG